MALAALACAVLVGCASGTAAGGTGRAGSKRASTPEAAAIGFDESVKRGLSGAPLRFDCLPPGDHGFNFASTGAEHPNAKAERLGGNRWRVIVDYPRHGSSAGYEVTFRDGGYCVSTMLSELPDTGPSATATHSS